VKPISRPVLQAICLSLAAFLTTLDVRAQTTVESLDQEELRELDIEQLLEIDVKSVYGASKYVQKITEAPSSITVITAADIRHYGYRTIGEILNSARGMFYTYDCNYARIGTRGFIRPGDYNARLQVLIDGHRVNENIFSGVGMGTDFILDIDLIQRVEIIRGASASIYGNNAFLGVVNIVTISGEGVSGTQIPLEAGSQSTYRGRITYGTRRPNGLDFLVSGSGMTSAGNKTIYYPEYDDPATNDGIARKVDDDRSASGFWRIAWKNLSFDAAVSTRTKQIPTGSFGRVFNHPGNKTRDLYSFLSADYEQSLARNTRWITRLFYDRYEYEGSYVYDNADPSDPPLIVKNRDLATGAWFGVESYTTTTLADRFVFSSGGEVRYNSLQDQRNFDVNPPTTYLDDHRTSRNWSLYTQTDLKIAPTFNLSAGVRYDRYTWSGGTINPRKGLIFLPQPRTAIKIPMAGRLERLTCIKRFIKDRWTRPTRISASNASTPVS